MKRNRWNIIVALAPAIVLSSLVYTPLLHWVLNNIVQGDYEGFGAWFVTVAYIFPGIILVSTAWAVWVAKSRRILMGLAAFIVSTLIVSSLLIIHS